MSTSHRRLSDARFLLILLRPGLTRINLLKAPANAFWGAAGIWPLITVVDTLIPGAQRSPAPLGPQPRLLWLLRLYVPVQLAMLAAGLLSARHADWLQVAGLPVAVGFVSGGQGITFAHELGHSRNKADREFGWVLMGSVNYGHFMVEHHRGQHPLAATFDDPASARCGESLWRFLPRTLWGSFASAWRLEAAQLQRMRRGWATSPLALSCGLNVAFILGLAMSGEMRMLAFWVGQADMAIWLLETVNSIEHYGLKRPVSADDRREPFAMHHAWTPYPELQALPGPQLPTGYAGCLLLTAVPPVWFALMDRRLGTTTAETATG